MTGAARRWPGATTPSAVELLFVRDAAAEPRQEGVWESISVVTRELDDSPIEDGTTHPAEALLASHIAAFGESDLLAAVRALDAPERAAAWIRLMGRMPRLEGALRRELACFGLKSASAEVRDATVQAMENWGDRDLARLLREHHDSVEWLQDYAARVAADLDA